MFLYFIIGFDVVISLMQAESLQNSFEANTVAFDIMFIVKTPKKTTHRRVRCLLTSPYKTEISRTCENRGKPCLVGYAGYSIYNQL